MSPVRRRLPWVRFAYAHRSLIEYPRSRASEKHWSRVNEVTTTTSPYGHGLIPPLDCITMRLECSSLRFAKVKTPSWGVKCAGQHPPTLILLVSGGTLGLGRASPAKMGVQWWPQEVGTGKADLRVEPSPAASRDPTRGEDDDPDLFSRPYLRPSPAACMILLSQTLPPPGPQPKLRFCLMPPCLMIRLTSIRDKRAITSPVSWKRPTRTSGDSANSRIRTACTGIAELGRSREARNS